jgi:hypothetical protein
VSISALSVGLRIWVADLEAGRDRIPEEWERDGSGVCLSLGDACDLDPALLAAMLGPDGLGGQSPGPAADGAVVKITELAQSLERKTDRVNCDLCGKRLALAAGGACASKRPSARGNIGGRRCADLGGAGLRPLPLAVRLPRRNR